MDALGIDPVVVVEDHSDLSREIGDFVDKNTQHRLHPRWLWRAEHGQDTFAEALPYGSPKRSNEVREEPDRIVVSFIQRHPGDGLVTSLAVLQPLDEQSGLSEASRSGDQGQLATGFSLESGGQPRARDQLRARLGVSQLGRYERVGDK